MPRVRRRVRPQCLGVSLVAALAATVVIASPPLRGSAAPAQEVRGLWVMRSTLTSRAAIARTVRDAATNGFNALFVQVRGRGDAYFRAGLEPLADSLRTQPSDFDPLQTVLDAARPLGLRVHAWVNVNLVASAHALPTSPTHLALRHPEWLMVPRDLARDMHGIAPSRPEYLTRLARWTKGQSAELEGIYSSPVLPQAAEHVAAVIADMVRRYRLDGLHLDYVRYPTIDFDYSAAALGEFRATVLPDLAPADRERLDQRVAVDPFAYTDMFPARWSSFRRTRLTALVMRIRTAAKAIDPKIVLSAAVKPDAADAIEHRLQDWPLWFDAELLDVICPMLYTPDTALFRTQLAELGRVSFERHRIWAGIGSYRLTPWQTISNIRSARQATAGGIVLFSYESLVDPARRIPDYLSQVQRGAFAENADQQPQP